MLPLPRFDYAAFWATPRGADLKAAVDDARATWVELYTDEGWDAAQDALTALREATRKHDAAVKLEKAKQQ